MSTQQQVQSQQTPFDEDLKNYIQTNQQAIEKLAVLENKAMNAIESIVNLSGGFEKNIEQLSIFFGPKEAEVSLNDGNNVPNILKAYNTLSQDIQNFKQTLTQDANSLKSSVTDNVTIEINRLSSEVQNIITKIQSKDFYTRQEIDIFNNDLQEQVKNIKEEIQNLPTHNVNTIMISKPSIQSPFNNQRNFSGNFVISNIVASEEVSNFSIRIQVSKTQDFESLSFNAIENNNIFTLPLEHNTNYYVRVRYEVGTIFSDYSETIQFTTPNVYITTPIITIESDASGSILLNPTIQGSSFSVVNGSDRHMATTLRIKDVATNSYIFDKKYQEPKTQIHLETPLQINKNYMFEMIYHGEIYTSAIGTINKITQNVFIQTPQITIDTSNGLRVSTSEFVCVNGEDTHQSTRYAIKRGGVVILNENSITNLTNWSSSMQNGHYTIEVSHIGAKYGESNRASKDFIIKRSSSNNIQLPEIIGDIEGKVISSHFCYFYGEKIQNNKKFQSARFEAIKDNLLVYVTEFGKEINYEARTEGKLTSMFLTESTKNLASGVKDAYKCFDGSSSTSVQIIGHQNIIFEYKEAVFLRRFQIVCTKEKEPKEVKLWGETTLGWNLLEHQTSTSGITLTYTISDKFNAYTKFKLEFISHRSENTSEVQSINFYTEEPPKIEFLLQNNSLVGEYEVRISHKAQGEQYVSGQKVNKTIKEVDISKEYLGFVKRVTDIELIRAINTGYEEDWRLISIPTAVINTSSFTKEYEILTKRLPFKNMKHFLVDIATGEREEISSDIDDISSKTSQKKSLSIMTRIPKTYYIAGTISFNSKTFYILCVGGEPFSIKLYPQMLFGNDQISSNISFSPMFQPQNYASGTVENNNSKLVKITSNLHPAFHGKNKYCEELFISTQAINSGRYNGGSIQEATLAQHRANIASLSEGNTDKNSVWDFWTTQLIMMLINVASQDNKNGRASRVTSYSKPLTQTWNLNSSAFNFFGLQSLFYSILHIDGVIANGRYFQVAHSDSLYGNEITSDYSSRIDIASYAETWNKILGTNYHSSSSSHNALMWYYDNKFFYNGYNLNSSYPTRSVFRDWKLKSKNPQLIL